MTVLVFRPLLFRRLSTSLPSGGAPSSPSLSSSCPALGAASVSPHPHSLPHSLHQLQPAVGAHPPHSSAPAAATAVPASVQSAGSVPGSGTSSSSSSLPQQPDTLAADAPPANESRLRRLIRQYGVVGVGSYLLIYVSTLGMLYVAIKERWLGGYDIQHIVDALGLSQYMEHIDPRKGDFAVAWIATKFTEPLRLALTAAITPTVARMLGRAPPKEGKGVRAAVEARMKEGVEQAKDRVEERIRERSTKHGETASKQ